MPKVTNSVEAEPRVASEGTVTISAPRLNVATFHIVGTAPYVQNRFGAKAAQQMRETQEAGQAARSKKKRSAKDFEAVCRDATHIAEDGWYGIPAPAFRNAMISACRLIGFKMTLAKMSVFVIADGIDADDGTPLVRLSDESGKPETHVMHVINSSMVADLRPRPMWRRWGADVRVRFDLDQFTAQDVANLLLRAGVQVGVGEGRPDSKRSNGLDWGTFTIKEGA
jgi:hypothetical protein